MIAWIKANPQRTFCLLFGLHLLLQAALAPRMLQVPFTGDEVAYVDGGRALSNVLRDLVAFNSPHWGEVQRNVVGHGWFMPGMSIVLTPLYVVAPDAGLGVTRLYLMLVSSLVLYLVARRTGTRLGQPAGLVLLVMPGLLPMWVVYSFTAWGDLWAGMLALLLLIESRELLLAAARGQRPRLAQGAQIGLLAIGTLYLRSSAQGLILGVLMVVAVGLVVLAKGHVRRAGVAASLAAVAVVGALLLPWSVTASAALDGRVVTTTSTATALANTFGDRQKVCFGPCDSDQELWFAPVRFARETARATGQSEMQVLAQMSTYARADLTAGSYGRQVASNFTRLLLVPAGYRKILVPAGEAGGSRSVLLLGGTYALYLPFLLALAAGLLVITRGPLAWQVQSILIKVMAAALLVQPFVHISSSRYWPTLAPLMALSAVLVWQVWSARREPPAVLATAGGVSPQRLSSILYAVQVAAVVGFLLAAAVVAALALGG